VDTFARQAHSATEEVLMSGWKRAATAAVAVALGVALAAPASATIVERGTYDEPYSDGYSDCGFDVAVEGVSSGHFTVRQGKNARSTAFFINDNYSFRETHTNVETGEFFTASGNAIFHEIKARPTGVPNQFEFTAVEAGQPFRVFDSDGNLVLRDRGSIFHRAIFDTGGDDVVGGVLIEELEPSVHGPHPGFMTDFCAIITPLIG
jgi:hypothetical protein